MNKLLENVIKFLQKCLTFKFVQSDRYQNRNQITNIKFILQNLKLKGYFPLNIVDVGCADGRWTGIAVKIFPDSRFFLFDGDDTNKNNLNKLKQKTRNIDYKICLLTDDESEYNFYKMGYGSSIYEEKTKHDRQNLLITSTTLKKELLGKIKNYNNLLKIDVQGSEIKVLKGLFDYIHLFEVIILEVSFHEYNKNSPLFTEVLNFMELLDYKIYDIFDLKRLGGKKSFLTQCDIVFIKKNSFLNSVKF